MRLLINNTEQAQPQQSDETQIVLFGRNAADPSDRIVVIVHGVAPYFYVRTNEFLDDENYYLSQDSITRVEHDVAGGIHGEVLSRVYPPYPQDTREARELFEEHWSADVAFTNRFRIDADIRAYIEVPDAAFQGAKANVHWREITPVEPDSLDANPGGSTGETALQNVVPRVCTLDIEVDDRAAGFPDHGDERILSIVAHDNYDDETVGFIDLNGRTIDDAFPDGGPDNTDDVRVENDERKMIAAFRDWFIEKDPDLITGWNVDDFDAPYLIERMNAIDGLNPDSLSPMGWAGQTNHGDVRIKGRTVYDLLTVYKKNSFTELRSYQLDDVAEEELDEQKIEFEGGYYDLYRHDTKTFLEYNAHDVHLTKDINEEAGVIEFRDTLRREVGVDFEDSYDNKDFVDMMCRRKLKERGLVGPSRPAYGEAPDSDYEGAFVFEPYYGVADNVVGIDLASLYPYTMAMLNASPDTRLADDEDAENVAEAPNGARFDLDQQGLFSSLVNDAISLKTEYKEQLQNAETSEERDKWENKYGVAKTITNSLYGVAGWERFFLYDEAVAEAVTLMGQHVIKATESYVEERGYDVLYGDTDSVYIKFPDDWSRDECLDEAFDICDELNEDVYPETAAGAGVPRDDNLWEIEVEAYMKSYFQSGAKKRYAYYSTWKDGNEIEDPKPTIVGFSSRRSDTAQLTVETEKRIFKSIFGLIDEDVTTIIADAAGEVTADAPEWERIGIPGGLKKKVTDDPRLAEQDDYYAVSGTGDATYPQDAQPRAAWNATQILSGVVIGEGDKPMRVYLRDQPFDGMERTIDVIGFESAADLAPVEDILRVDTQRMIETIIVSPLSEICNAIDVDVTAAVRGQKQSGLGAFTVD